MGDLEHTQSHCSDLVCVCLRDLRNFLGGNINSIIEHWKHSQHLHKRTHPRTLKNTHAEKNRMSLDLKPSSYLAVDADASTVIAAEGV